MEENVLKHTQNIKNYHLAKLNLIRKQRRKNSFLFIQDEKLKKKFSSFKNNLLTQNYFLTKNNVSLTYKELDKFSISVKKYSYNIRTFNDFMVKNVLTILMLYNKIIKGFPIKFNKSILPPGRSEIIYSKNNKSIIIDYAHSKDAYENLLHKLPSLSKNIIIIYGCGGDRDKSKRAQIAKVVSKYTKLQIITDDNPRNENPEKIRKTLLKNSSNPIEVPNRKRAIKYGINYIKKNNGILIIAGKGHEEIQTYKNKNYIFNDRLISSNYAKNL